MIEKERGSKPAYKEVVVSEECPEIEMLAAYVDRNLKDAERRVVEAHMVVCKVCRQTVILTFRTKAAIPDPQSPDFDPPVDPSDA